MESPFRAYVPAFSGVLEEKIMPAYSNVKKVNFAARTFGYDWHSTPEWTWKRNGQQRAVEVRTADRHYGRDNVMTVYSVMTDKGEYWAMLSTDKTWRRYDRHQLPEPPCVDIVGISRRTLRRMFRDNRRDPLTVPLRNRPAVLEIKARREQAAWAARLLAAKAAGSMEFAPSWGGLNLLCRSVEKVRLPDGAAAVRRGGWQGLSYPWGYAPASLKAQLLGS